jgi:hypothetical protein
MKVKPFEADLNIILSMPGIGLISAATILAEVGDCRDFQNADKLAMCFWHSACGPPISRGSFELGISRSLALSI